ncbi:MAG: hypothetical protein A2Y82_05535 [Candidatus Buchananbacteria bacterium RBG_13_36_9]|uniref:Uncharacterized protein n=1 Tax=Candidatus Buchananbacteria bacterium RBG_13_36_9 TaxID=1797530 RepID=A0A1G1XPA7_9BACT|nr:MAG: hypothetical protein A2Y82_05535 [Candidatus Buchananbacteria bacterium RBG_13_36_9]
MHQSEKGKIRQEDIYNFAQKGLFIRGSIEKNLQNLDRAQIYILSGTRLVKGVCVNYIENYYTYCQLDNGKEFVARLEQRVFVPKENIDILRGLQIWGDDYKIFEKPLPEVIVARIINNNFEGSTYKQLPLSDPAVISHLSRMHGLIDHPRDPEIGSINREKICSRLGSLISQQLRKWSRMMG